MTGGPLFAALSRVDLQVQGQPLGKTPFLLFKDVILIVMVALALMLALMFWAKYLRNWKPKKRRSEGQKVYRDRDGSDEGDEPEEEPSDEAANVRRRYKYRYKRRSHRSRNPTLSQTGGLPPARTGESPGSS